MSGEAAAGDGKMKRRRTGGRSARVRETVLDATVEVLLEVGLEGFSIPEVAEKAGVHKTSIYRRWGDAPSLLLDALLSRVGEEIPVPDTGSLRGDLKELVRKVAGFLEGPIGNALVRTTMVEAGSVELSMGRTRYWERRFALNREIFERAIERGEMEAGTDPDLGLEALIGPLYLRVLVTGKPLEEGFLDGVVETILNGLYARN